MTRPKNVCLLIMDGWGMASAWGGNAISLANTPNFNVLWRSYPHTLLRAAAEAVGLPRKEIGNSEVGHLNIGAGHVVHQDHLLINNQISDGSFFKNPVLLGAFDFARKNNSNVHILGLASPGGVHSHLSHMFALLDMSASEKFDRVFLHLFTDGRDTAPMDALSCVASINQKINQTKIGKIESLAGRYYAMDRNQIWQRTKKVYDLLLNGNAPMYDIAERAISNFYQKGISDEFVEPVRIGQENQFVPIKSNDAIIIFNFRRDRIDQLIRSLVLPDFDDFERQTVLQNIYLASFTNYESGELPVHSAFKPKIVSTPLASVLSQNGLRQFHIAETEKYAHVTYFFNGGIETPFPNEDRMIIDSPRAATYDMVPEMSAYKITGEVVEKIKDSRYDFIVANFANADMVGHTGNLEATVKACEAVDRCIGKISEINKEIGGITIITADHGNAEQMLDPVDNSPYTEHTTNPVPFIIVDNNITEGVELPTGNLANIFPTILSYLNLPKSEFVTGTSLIKREGYASNQIKK